MCAAAGSRATSRSIRRWRWPPRCGSASAAGRGARPARATRDSAIALSKRSPIEPIDGTRPESIALRVNAHQVDWVLWPLQAAVSPLPGCRPPMAVPSAPAATVFLIGGGASLSAFNGIQAPQIRWRRPPHNGRSAPPASVRRGGVPGTTLCGPMRIQDAGEPKERNTK